jgi:predicted  nucleic acid-binding Zn-ribbon protein
MKLRYEESRRRHAELVVESEGAEREAVALRNDERALEAEASNLRHKLLSLQQAASSVGGVEYRSAEAMAHEMVIVEERVSGIEMQALDRLSSLEVVEKRCEELGKATDDALRLCQELEHQWSEIEAKLCEELERVELQIEAAVEEFDAGSAALYRRLVTKTSGVVFSMLTDGRCEYCNSTLAAFEYDKIRAAAGESELTRRIRCAECGRILLVRAA